MDQGSIIIDAPITLENLEIGKNYDTNALEGLLTFLEALYEDLINDIKKGLSPQRAIESELDEVRRLRKAWLN